MNIETIKNNIDRKIDNFLKENLSFRDIITRLQLTSDNFKRLLTADNNSSARQHMITMYNNFSEKRIADIKWIDEYLSTNSFFAGINDIDSFKLLKLRDRISEDVLLESN